jgi:hypothetical protein
MMSQTPTAGPVAEPVPVTTAIEPDACVGFGELSIVEDGDEFVVGDPAAGIFVSLPKLGVTAIELLRSGRTVAEVTADMAELAGEEVKIDEFVAGLADAGLIRSVNGVPLAAATAGAPARGWITGVSPQHARLLFGRVAWTFYGLCAVWCVFVQAFLPEYRPSFESILFYPDPALSMVVIAAVAIVAGSLHEAWHWLAARAEGVGVRFAISRRAFLPVFETDLSQLWGTPRRRRYGPLLAGLAFDVMVMAAALTLRIAAAPVIPSVADRFLAVVVAVQVVAIILQCMICLRTDLYLIVSTALGCQDLLRVTRLYLKGQLWRLSKTQSDLLDAAHPRDRRAAPWFAIAYLAGLGLLTWIFLNLWLPGTAVTGGWIVLGLWHASFTQRTFWEGLMIAVILLSQALLPLALYVKERLRAIGSTR